MPHRVVVSLDLIAGVLMMIDVIIPKERLVNTEQRLKGFLSRLSGDYLLVSALAVWIVFSVAVVGFSSYKDIVNHRLSSPVYVASTTLTVIGLSLGSGSLAVLWKVLPELAKLTEKRHRLLGFIIILVAFVVLAACLGLRIGIHSLGPGAICLLSLVMGFSFGAVFLQGFLMIVEDLGQILNRENNVLIMAGLILFVVTRILELMYG
jgi:hypothetical protein